MIKKITKIKKLGIFDGFTWPADLAEFKRYNILYGWNGTGKTTLSKLFSYLNKGEGGEFPNLKYELSDGDGTTYTQGQEYPTPIRVFNQDYIDDNVVFDTTSAKPILILGEDNQELIEKIATDQALVEGLEKDLVDQTRQKTQAATRRDGLFTDIARTIGQNTKGAISRNYRKPDAEAAFRKLTAKQLLSDGELAILNQQIAQASMDKLEPLKLQGDLAQVDDLTKRGVELAKTTVQAQTIQRLQDNADIASWVEDGVEIHKKHQSTACEFCGNVLSEDRIKELAGHFNDADKNLKRQIDELIDQLRVVYSFVQQFLPIDRMNVYPDLREQYSGTVRLLDEERKGLLESIEDLVKELKAKKLSSTQEIILKALPSAEQLQKEVSAINSIISEHNKKTDEFEANKLAASKKVEAHFLSTIFDTANELAAKAKDCETKVGELTHGIEGDPENIGMLKLKQRVQANRAKVSSSHKACKILNDSLTSFLGHSEISFAVDDDEGGYTMMRGDSVAKSLSEGEKTAIAFIYFTVQLQDESFDCANGIIVVDDPISSLDANSQYQAFAFLKHATTDAKQLFVFTHNFDFLKLLLNWQKGLGDRHARYMMVDNHYSMSDGSRLASIKRLDPDLQKFESEYHYLFDTVYRYKSDGTIANAYKMPNIARKVLDNFLMFRIPSSETTYKRLARLDFDEQKKSAIYKFVNDQSHITGSGFDPALVPEAQKNVGYLLELMESTFPEHYEILKESLVS